MRSRAALKKFTFWFPTFVLLALGVVAPSSLRAQVAGATLRGTVTDASGAAIPNSKVSIKNTATGVTRDVTSDAVGLYSSPNLLPGNYEVTTSAPGFSTQVQTGITLEVGASQVLNISLRVGQVAQEVQVTSAAPTVELTTSAVSAEVNATTMRELPLNGRDWTQLATLQPGVISIRTQSSASSFGSRGNRGFGNELSDSGHTPYQNNYRINGISVNDYTNGSPGSVLGVQLGVDGIQEFSVLTTNYSADYGRASGAIINAITRSGTNQFHGSAYYFLRDKVLDARNFFDGPTIPPFHRNQFGASGGGPIRKGKTFIFVDYEGIRQRVSQSLHDTVPTAAARAGNLCSVPTTGSCTPNTITVDPKVIPYLPLWPMPNAGLTPSGNGDTGFFNGAALSHLPENYITVRGDHKASEKDTFAVSWFRDNSSISLPDALLVGIHESLTARQMGSLEWTHIFNPGLANTARVGYSRSEGIINSPVSAINPLGADTSLGAVPGDHAPTLSVPGLTVMQGALGDPSAADHHQNSYQAYDDAFITKGYHSIKIGFAVERIQYNFLGLSAHNGQFNFPSLQGFLTNHPSSLTLLDPDPTLFKEIGARQSLFGVYVQDDWRMRPNLTLNLGLRYEPTTLPVEAHNGFGVMENLFSGGVTAPVPSLWQTNSTLRNFQPRIGFAWDPFKTGKTSLRGGFGIYDVLPLPWAYVQVAGSTIPFGVTVAGGNLPVGSFPTGAPALIPFIPSKAASPYFNQHPRRSYDMNWNLNIQREITPSLTAMVGYVGSHSVHLPWKALDQDMVLPTLTSAGYLWPFPVGSGTRLNTSVGAINGTFWDSSATYEGLQAQVKKRMSHGIQAQASYTWSKCIDTNSSSVATDTFLNSVRDLPFFDQQARRGLCDYNIAHNFVANYIWQLPTPRFGGAAAEHILGGWELGGILTASTGTPFTLLISGNPLGQNSSDAIDFPNRLWGQSGCANPVNPGNVNNYVKLNCFTPPVAPASFAAVCQPAAASVAAVIPNTCMNLFGNNGRNSLIGPGLFEVDFSAFKNNYIRRISESFNIQFRAEFFNIFNRANFQSPLDNKTIFTQTGTLVGGAGVIDATTTTSRQIQLGLKVIW